MSAASHTPGPWKAQISADFVGGNSYSIFTAHENRSAQVQDLVAASFPGTVHGHGPANISGPEARANAALIAAAPELLAALESCVRAMSSRGLHYGMGNLAERTIAEGIAIDKAKAALEKAQAAA